MKAPKGEHLWVPRQTKPHVANKHIIAEVRDATHNYFLHATKGWRRERRAVRGPL